MASVHTWKLLLHLTGCLSINRHSGSLLLLKGEDFVIHEETFCSCLSDLLQSVGKEVTLRPPVGSRVDHP